MAFERVHTVSNFHDRPREGLADYGGMPHRYKSEWDEAADSWSDLFQLTPVDMETFLLEIERWQIWRAWERAFHSGRATLESHPSKGGINLRYDELGKEIESRMVSFQPIDVRPTANFRSLPGQDLPGHMMRELEVEWILPPNTSLERTRDN